MSRRDIWLVEKIVHRNTLRSFGTLDRSIRIKNCTIGMDPRLSLIFDQLVRRSEGTHELPFFGFLPTKCPYGTWPLIIQ